jgi:hypothetical protein
MSNTFNKEMMPKELIKLIYQVCKGDIEKEGINK